MTPTATHLAFGRYEGLFGPVDASADIGVAFLVRHLLDALALVFELLARFAKALIFKIALFA